MKINNVRDGEVNETTLAADFNCLRAWRALRIKICMEGHSGIIDYTADIVFNTL